MIHRRGFSRDASIPYEGLWETHLPECQFRGRENRKIQYAILTSAALRAGLEPDLLDEVVWWHNATTTGTTHRSEPGTPKSRQINRAPNRADRHLSSGSQPKTDTRIGVTSQT